jgi:hypothetical protein
METKQQTQNTIIMLSNQQLLHPIKQLSFSIKKKKPVSKLAIATESRAHKDHKHNKK